MHVVHVIARLNDGGPARVLRELCLGLGARGHECRILCGSTEAGEPDLRQELVQAGVVVEAIPFLRARPGPLGDCKALRHLVRRLRTLRPDLVHTHTAKAGFLGRLAARYLGIPFLHTYHGHVLRGHLPRLGALAALGAERLMAGDGHLHALTPSLAVDLSRRYRIGKPHRWHVLPIPVAPVAPRLPAWASVLVPGTPVIGFLGRLAPVKDPLLWIEALERVARTRPVQGLMAGDGALRAEVASAIAAKGLSVHLPGFIPAAEALSVMDVLVLTSRQEGLPLVAVEAGSAGVPVVAPLVGGLRDLAAQGAVCGTVRSSSALAAAILAVLDGQGRTRLKDAGHQLAASLIPAALLPRYEALYAEVCHPHAAGTAPGRPHRRRSRRG